MIILRQKEFNNTTHPSHRKSLLGSFLSKKSIKSREGSGNESLSQKVIDEFKKTPNAEHVVGGIMVNPVIKRGGESFSGYINKWNANRIRRGKKVKGIKIDPRYLEDPSFSAGIIKLNNLKDTPVLAHELGHAERAAKGSLFNGIEGKLRDSKLLKRSGAIGLASGFASGYNQTKNSDDSTIKKIGTYVPIIAINTPVLVEEADASRRGLKLMKKAGATKAQLKASRKTLGYALGTYAISPVAQLAMTGVGRVAGKVAGKQSKKNKEQEKINKLSPLYKKNNIQGGDN